MTASVGLPDPDVVGEGSAAPRTLRRKSALWDRLKFLVLLGALFAFFFWEEMSDNPLVSTRDALALTSDARGWVFVLFGVELLRQAHFLVSEHWPAYHRFWTEKVFGRFERRLSKLNPWTRYRIGRVLKWLLYLAVLSIVLGALFGAPPLTALFELPARLVDALPFAFQMMFGFFYVILQFAGLFWFLTRGGTDVYFPDDIKTRFTDVWGQDNVLERIKENIVFLEKPELIEEKGGYVPSGILLWGPPGTGKTLMAEAVAGETGKPFVFVDPGSFTQMFMGVGILKVKSLFRKLRKLALRYGGVIVFFDEADSLGSRGQLSPGFQHSGASPFDADHLRWLSPHAQAEVLRASMTPSGPDDRARRDGIMMGMGGGGGMGTLQALLTELSGLKKPRGFLNRVVRRTLGMRPKPPPKYRILVMMATNLPQALDEALLRPGRIDRMYKVGYPSKDGRRRTYEGYLDKVSHVLTPEQIEKLAVITPYATGASIKDLVNEALICAIREGRDYITWSDAIKAKHLKALGPGEDVEYIDRERHAIAIHEACHAVAAYRQRRHFEIDIATIEKGSTYLGMVASIPPEDQFSHWRAEYEADIQVSLASLAGERMFFRGDNSSGVSGDLDSATTLATLMEGLWGMGETLSSYRVARNITGGGGGPGSGRDDEDKPIDKTLGKRVEANLRRLFEQTESLLAENRRQVFAVAHALERHKTLTGEDVAAVIDGVPGPLVDGRWYATDEFLASAEAYHAQAEVAHDAHGPMEAPLPLPPAAVLPMPALVANGDVWGGEVWGNGSGNGSGNGAGHGPDPYGYPAAPPTVPGGVTFPPPKVPPTPPPATRPPPPPVAEADEGPAEPAG